MYIAFEGIIRVGKTSQINRLADYIKGEFPNKELLIVREPYGPDGELSSKITSDITAVVQGNIYEGEEMTVECETLLYAASRSQMAPAIRSNLGAGGITLSDRCFAVSGAYQGYVRGFGVDRVLRLNLEIMKGLVPDIVVFLSLKPDIAIKRELDKERDRWERMDLEFFNNVCKGFELVSKHPIFKDRWITVDASGTVDEVSERVLKELGPHLAKLK